MNIKKNEKKTANDFVVAVAIAIWIVVSKAKSNKPQAPHGV